MVRVIEVVGYPGCKGVEQEKKRKIATRQWCTKSNKSKSESSPVEKETGVRIIEKERKNKVQKTAKRR